MMMYLPFCGQKASKGFGQTFIGSESQLPWRDELDNPHPL